MHGTEEMVFRRQRWPTDWKGCRVGDSGTRGDDSLPGWTKYLQLQVSQLVMRIGLGSSGRAVYNFADM